MECYLKLQKVDFVQITDIIFHCNDGNVQYFTIFFSLFFFVFVFWRGFEFSKSEVKEAICTAR